MGKCWMLWDLRSDKPFAALYFPTEAAAIKHRLAVANGIKKSLDDLCYVGVKERPDPLDSILAAPGPSPEGKP